MKKLFILFFLCFVISLQASMIGDFRKAQRATLLSEFKSLYKQRNMSVHTAKLKYKYSRVKKIKHPSLRHHFYVTSTNPLTTIENSSLQVKSNTILNEIISKKTDTEHPFTKVVYQPIIPQNDISPTIDNEYQDSIITQYDILQTHTNDEEISKTIKDETAQIEEQIRSEEISNLEIQSNLEQSGRRALYSNPWGRK
jgi:hypothetical protein